MKKYNECIPHNFFDELYNVFKAKRTTMLSGNDLINSFWEQYGKRLIQSSLIKIPFIQICTSSKVFYLVIELDDCCDQGNKCNSRDCKLLHFVNSNDQFKQLYPQSTETSKRVNRRFKTDTYVKLSPLKLPEICLKQRVIEILNVSQFGAKQMLWDKMRDIHNQKYPQYTSHCPTAKGIYLRHPLTFTVVNDYTGKYKKILLNEIIPDQNNKYYASISISPQWTDQILGLDLIQHVRKHTDIDAVDVYIKNVERLGYFSTSNKSVADALIRCTKIQCYGRKIRATMVGTRWKHKPGYRVKILNLPLSLNSHEFEKWIYLITNTSNRRHLIYDTTITFSKHNVGSYECIMVFNQKKDVECVIQKMNQYEFRGFCIRFKQWNHPDYQLDNNCVNDEYYSDSKQNVFDEGYEAWDKYEFRNSPSKYKESKVNAIHNKMKDILNTMTDVTFENMLHEMQYIINNEIETKQQIQDLINLILEFAIQNIVFVDECVNLCLYLQNHFSDMNKDKSIANMIVNHTCLLFTNNKNNKINSDKSKFFGVIELIGQLHNVGLFNENLIYNGVLKHLLPIDIEGFCRLLMKCGKSLDRHNSQTIDTYLKTLITMKKEIKNKKHIQLINKVIKMRDDIWIQNEESQQIYKVFEDKYREIYLKQQGMQTEMNKLMDEYKWMKESEILKDKYRDLELNQQPTKKQMNTLLNQYKKLKIKYDKLKQEAECNNGRKYLLWNANDITNWIVNLNKIKYNKYYVQLKNNLQNEE
eukprot:448694_1